MDVKNTAELSHSQHDTRHGRDGMAPADARRPVSAHGEGHQRCPAYRAEAQRHPRETAAGGHQQRPLNARVRCCPWDDAAAGAGARHRSGSACIKYATLNGCPVHRRAVAYLVERCDYGAVMSVDRAGCPAHKDAANWPAATAATAAVVHYDHHEACRYPSDKKRCSLRGMRAVRHMRDDVHLSYCMNLVKSLRRSAYFEE